MAGGTGGHIFPGLALARELQKHSWHIEWMGTADRMEADIVPKHDIAIHYIDIKGIRGNGLLRKLALPFTLLNAVSQARAVLKTLRPDVVVGFGGYASGPGGIAARSLGIPLIIHEQNAVLGMTNKWLSKIAYKTFLAFDLTRGQKPEFEVVGNPVRSEIVDLGKQSKRQLTRNDKIRILVIGGSLGAKVLNESLPAIFVESIAKNDQKLEIRHQSGKQNKDNVIEQYQKVIGDHPKITYVIDEFIDDMTSALNWCDLVVCRAGALTVSELAASGNAGIFVPLPYAVDDHQTANANWLVKQDAGILIPQAKLETLSVTLEGLITSPEKINKIQSNAQAVGQNEATAGIFALCQKLEISN